MQWRPRSAVGNGYVRYTSLTLSPVQFSLPGSTDRWGDGAIRFDPVWSPGGISYTFIIPANPNCKSFLSSLAFLGPFGARPPFWDDGNAVVTLSNHWRGLFEFLAVCPTSFSLLRRGGRGHMSGPLREVVMMAQLSMALQCAVRWRRNQDARAVLRPGKVSVCLSFDALSSIWVAAHCLRDRPLFKLRV